MTQPALLIFATRYDGMTERTHKAAQRLEASAGQLGIRIFTLYEGAATGAALLEAAARRPAVVAFYSHGDALGAILAQDRQPCWTTETIPDLSGIAVFAQACRAIRWLRDEAAHHKVRLLVGYATDLVTPANGSGRFWELYEGVHSLVPYHLVRGADQVWIRQDFYEFCTSCFDELNSYQAGLIELVAIQQSRDEIVFA